MSLGEDRAAVVAAVNVLDPAVRCGPYFRQISNPGDAMVRLDRLDRDESGFGFMAVWQVAVALSQDAATAERWMDEYTADLVTAVSDALVVTGARFAQLALDSRTVPVLIVEGNRPS